MGSYESPRAEIQTDNRFIEKGFAQSLPKLREGSPGRNRSQKLKGKPSLKHNAYYNWIQDQLVRFSVNWMYSPAPYSPLIQNRLSFKERVGEYSAFCVVAYHEVQTMNLGSCNIGVVWSADSTATTVGLNDWFFLNRLEFLALSDHRSLGEGGTFCFKTKGWKKKKAPLWRTAAKQKPRVPSGHWPTSVVGV
jgi:hypothetical protein